MSKGQRRSPVRAAIQRLLIAQDTVTSGDVARAAGVSRQGAHYQLIAMTELGELIHEGRGRGSRFRRGAFLSYHYDLGGLREDEVWSEESAELRRRGVEILDNPKLQPLLKFVVTSMVNNAIDHSRGSALDTTQLVSALASRCAVSRSEHRYRRATTSMLDVETSMA